MVCAATVTGNPARRAALRADIEPLPALRQHRAPDDIVDLAALNTCALDRLGDGQAPPGWARGWH